MVRFELGRPGEARTTTSGGRLVLQQLIDDARNWSREVERHKATERRLEQLLHS